MTKNIVDKAIELGVNFFDTAEVGFYFNEMLLVEMVPKPW